jgi:hypothetical protein
MNGMATVSRLILPLPFFYHHSSFDGLRTNGDRRMVIEE